MRDLVEELRQACSHAPAGDKVLTIHLFGIREVRCLQGVNLRELAECAGIGASFGTELRKGMRLAERVRIVRD